MADYIVQEDGTSRFILEDASGDLIVEEPAPGFISSVTAVNAPQVAYTDTTAVTLAGTYLWECPPGITQAFVECYGGGGPGASNTGNNDGDAGGGGGAYASRSAVPVTAGTLYTFVVGAAGAFGSDGGNSTFTGDSSVVVIAAGGGHAVSITKGTGGQASASTGDSGQVHSGGDGGVGVTGIGGGAGAGGGASGNSAAAGANGTNALLADNNPKPGGIGANGGGSGGTGAVFPTPPATTGSSPGGAGAGSTFGGAGSLGADGKVAITTGVVPVTPPLIASITVVHAPVISATDVRPSFIGSVTLVYTPNLRITFTGAGVSQVALETMASNTDPLAYLSQVTLEILVPNYKGLHVHERN